MEAKVILKISFYFNDYVCKEIIQISEIKKFPIIITNVFRIENLEKLKKIDVTTLNQIKNFNGNLHQKFDYQFNLDTKIFKLNCNFQINKKRKRI